MVQRKAIGSISSGMSVRIWDLCVRVRGVKYEMRKTTEHYFVLPEPSNLGWE
jgi:hypothetical protein